MNHKWLRTLEKILVYNKKILINNQRVDLVEIIEDPELIYEDVVKQITEDTGFQ